MIVLGSVHAFSVFLEPLETRFQSSRSSISLTYSFALMTLTAIVLFGHRLYGLLKPTVFIGGVCILAAIGAFIAASASQLFVVWIGYSLLFGAANGLGYGYALQISAQANPNHKGLAMGLVTASYALGAVLSPWPLTMALTKFGLAVAMSGLGLAALLIMPIIILAFHKGNARLELPELNQASTSGNQNRSTVLLLWLAYGSAVTAGLMAIGHATGIAQEGGVSSDLILAAPIILAVFNMGGSLLGGWMADRFSTRLVLTTLPLISAISLFALSQIVKGNYVLMGLAATGFIYGAIIAVYPTVINQRFGAIEGIRVYGKVFTAWGFAGLFGPWLAGTLYDQYTDYSIALLVAAATGLLSAGIAFISVKPVA